jgi:hypothetical protein
MCLLQPVSLCNAPTFINIGKVGAEPVDRVQHSLTVWSVQCLDRLGIQILYCLLVTPAHAVLCPRVPIERIDGLGNAHL